MSNSWFPNQRPQQWNTPAGFNPQQQQGWGAGRGQWQPMQQAVRPGGFVNQPQQFHGPGQFTGHPQQFLSQPGYGRGVPMSNPAQGYPQQQQQFHQQQQQQFQQQQQQQQMSYIQEQQRLLKEEQRRREMEIQKRKLRSVDVSNPKAGSLSFDNLIGITPSQRKPSGSPGPSRAPSQINTSTAPSTDVQSSNPLVVSTSGDPLPTSHGLAETRQQSATPPPPSSSASGQTKGTSQAAEPKTSGTSFEKLIESSLSNLNDPSPTTRKKMVFKTTPSNRPLPANSSPKTFSESRKARAWTAGETDFSGMFAQHQQQPETQDDSFGEFQSVGSGPGFPAHVVPEQPAGFQGSSLPQQSNPGFVTQNNSGQSLLGPQQIVPGQQQQAEHILVQGIGQAQQQQPFANSAVTFTSTHLHPLPSTSVSGTTSLITSTASSGLPGNTAVGKFKQLEASKFPPLYLEVYRRSVVSGQQYVSTELLFPILMSSQLPKNILRDLWTVANRKVPGKLDQTELFVLLGLIGLAQSGITSPTPEDLKRAPAPPIPKLSAIKELSLLPQSVSPVSRSTPPQPSTASPPVDEYGDFQQHQAPTLAQPPMLRTSPQPLKPALQVSQPLITPSSIQNSVATTAGSMLGPLASSVASEYKPPSDDKYGAFSELQGLNQPSQTMQGNLFPSSSAQSEPLTTLAGSNFLADVGGLTQSTLSGTGTSLLGPMSSSAVSASSSTSIAGDDFGSFVQTPYATTATNTQQPAFSSTDKKLDGGNLTQPASSEPPKGSPGWADFASFSLPSSSLPVTSSSSVTTTTTTGFSAFDSITIPELAASKPPPPANEESFTLGTGLGLTEDKPSTRDKSPVKKQLTGLEILEEEFSARVAQSHLEKESTTSAVDMSQPLIPESAPLDEFGEFEAYSSPGDTKTTTTFAVKESPPSARTNSKTKEKSDPCKVWRTCLGKCAEVLVTCSEIFTGVEEANVLKEIAGSEEGKNKLRGIVEVYRMAKRVYCCLKEKDKEAENEDSVHTIQKQWKVLSVTLPDNVMQTLYSETVKVEPEEEDVLSITISTCSLCLMSKNISISTFLSLDGKQEEYGMPLLFHQGQCYHASCANFWINVIQEELPVLS